jgi:predicted peptidase
MSRVLATFGISLLLAACTAGATPSQQKSEPPASTASSTAAATPTPTPAPTPSPSPVAWPEGITAHPANSASNDVGLLSYLPPGYEDDDAVEWPLLVFLHGSEEYGDGSEAQLPKVLTNGIPAMIAAGEWPAELPFVVLIPQYSFAEANGPCALNDETESVIEWANRTYRIDPARIYLTGISCGAIGVLDYLANTDDNRVAATVPISSAPYTGPNLDTVRGGCAIARTPTWFFHGALDDIVPVNYVEDAVTELHACTNPPPKEVKLTVYPDADHDAWTRTYDLSAGHDVYAWLLEQELD